MKKLSKTTIRKYFYIDIFTSDHKELFIKKGESISLKSTIEMAIYENQF